MFKIGIITYRCICDRTALSEKQAAFMKQRRLAKAENQLYMEQIQKQNQKKEEP